MKYEFRIEKTANPKPKPDPDTLKFGRAFSDHMLIMDYDDENGWHDGRIVPYGPIALDPAAAVLHYAQEIFEGLKAYRARDGRVLLFRPDMNAARAARSCDRICIPRLDDGLFVEAVKAIVSLERGWIPEKEGTSLYIRPFIFADEPVIGVHPAHHYKFVIICSPVGPYYDTPGGSLAATSIFVEEEYVRAFPGGTGFAKVGGNYAASLKAQGKAAARGCEQALWLDAIERKYVEEIGTSNAFFVIDGEVITAPLSGTILPGVTRDSVIALLKKWGARVSERRLSIDDVRAAAEGGRLGEVFAAGTAAVISPVGRLVFENGEITISGGKVGELSQRLYETLYGLQTGDRPDDMGWTAEV
ncbi:MAG: branched-chain amino acid aminotransferase [Oscillospiraceae bacterium]|jgi:branched-chain amino acid aminotransferase|nr:branched-chain amino acid aminotransferase [Oscillospiraceae bacterium]